MGFVLDQGDDHAVEVKEEQDEMETELGERFLWHSVSSSFSDVGGERISTFL